MAKKRKAAIKQRLRWRCKAPGCDLDGDWQPVEAKVGPGADPRQVALAELYAHYARAHPELADDTAEEVVGDAAQLRAA